MKISCVPPSELGSQEIEHWHFLQDADGRLDNPFFSPEFARAVGNNRSGVKVAVLEDNNRIVGFLPFEMVEAGVGRAIGHGVSDAQGLIVHSSLEWDWLDVLRHTGLKFLDFDHLVWWQANKESMHTYRVASPVADLSNGFAAYEAERRAAHRERFKGFDKKLRRMEREMAEPVFTFDSADPECVRILKEWKSAQYRRSGYKDIWSDAPYRNLVEELLATKTDYLRGVMSTLYVDDYPAALQISLQSKRTLAGWVTAYDDDLSMYSPGIALLRHVLKASDTEGFTLYEFGKGDESFKQIFRTGDIELAAAWTALRSIGAIKQRVRKAPREHVERFVLQHPVVRQRVRRTLQSVGKFRSS